LDRKEKEQVVAELHEKLKGFKLAVLTGYSGMDVARITALRVALRKSGTDMRIVKNTLLRIASQGTDFSAMNEHIKGPLALVLTDKDVVETVKVLVEFAKKNSEMEIRAAMLEGKLLNREQVNAVALLPSREILISRLLSVLIGVPTGLVSVLSAVPRGMVQVLDAYREKKESLQ
jgi:large subunit ribosomal protein L10